MSTTGRSLFNLTPLTGREAAATRTVVVAGVEVNWRVWVIVLSAAPVAGLLVLLCWPLLGQIGLFWFLVVETAALVMFYRRSRRGLKLHTYRSMWDRRTSTVGKVFLCGVEVDLREDDIRVVRSNTVPRTSRTSALAGVDPAAIDFFAAGGPAEIGKPPAPERAGLVVRARPPARPIPESHPDRQRRPDRGKAGSPVGPARAGEGALAELAADPAILLQPGPAGRRAQGKSPRWSRVRARAGTVGNGTGHLSRPGQDQPAQDRPGQARPGRWWPAVDERTGTATVLEGPVAHVAVGTPGTSPADGDILDGLFG